ncbi:MAG: VanZ family protein [Bacteroidales bacterium]|nr:VanZ family protein [Bacteroidales bacterium]
MSPKRKWIPYLKIYRWFFRYWKTISWAILVYWLSTFSVYQKNHHTFLLNIPHLDKAVHFFMYFTLITLWLSDYFKVRQICLYRKMIWIVVACFFYGVLMELIQAFFTTNRNGDILDAITNGLGAIIGLILFKYLGIYRKVMIRIVTQRRVYKSC